MIKGLMNPVISRWALRIIPSLPLEETATIAMAAINEAREAVGEVEAAVGAEAEEVW
jgi:hypothetical protein